MLLKKKEMGLIQDFLQGLTGIFRPLDPITIGEDITLELGGVTRTTATDAQSFREIEIIHDSNTGEIFNVTDNVTGENITDSFVQGLQEGRIPRPIDERNVETWSQETIDKCNGLFEQLKNSIGLPNPECVGVPITQNSLGDIKQIVLIAVIGFGAVALIRAFK